MPGRKYARRTWKTPTSVPVSEMVRLIETIRHFESQQKVIQGYDEMLERAIRSLGDV